MLFWRKFIGLMIVLSIALLICFYAIWGEKGLKELNRQKTRLVNLEKEIENLSVENATLQESIDALQNNQVYIEKIARESHDFVKQGEVIYYFN